MAIKLTDAAVAKLRPEGKRTFVRDTAQTGFMVQVLPSGAKAFYVEGVVSDGRKFQHKIAPVDAMSVDDARQKAIALLVEAKKGIHPKDASKLAASSGRTKTLKEAMELLLREKQLKARTADDYKYHLQRYLRDWLNLPVDRITEEMVRTWYAAGRETPTTTDNVRRSFSAVMSYCLANGWIERNPCDVIKRARLGYKKQQRTKALSIRDELGPFLYAISRFKPERGSQQTAADVILFMLAHGSRKRESFSLQWKDVDLKRRIFVIAHTKNGVPLELPMSVLTWRMFKARHMERRQDQEWVFPNKSGNGPITDVRKTFSQIIKLADIRPYSLHDLRRTFASVADFLEISERNISALLNHKSKNITQRYIDPQRLEAHLANIHAKYDELYRQERGKGYRGEGLDRDLFAKRMYPSCYDENGNWYENMPSIDELETHQP